MRVPWASAVLALAVIAVYVYSSGGLLYPDSGLVAQNAFGSANPLALVFSLFFHIGVHHVVGNLVPLIVFALLLEMTLSGRDVLAVFLSSGLVAAFVFFVLNPASFLAGASGGIAGLMTAACLSRPKFGAVLLLVVPLFMTFVASPALAFAESTSFSDLNDRVALLMQQSAEFEASGQFEAAEKARADAAATNATLVKQEASAAAEKKAVPDFLVHLAGALVGALYVLALYRDRVRDGFEEVAVMLDGALGRTRSA